MTISRRKATTTKPTRISGQPSGIPPMVRSHAGEWGPRVGAESSWQASFVHRDIVVMSKEVTKVTGLRTLGDAILVSCCFGVVTLQESIKKRDGRDGRERQSWALDFRYRQDALIKSGDCHKNGASWSRNAKQLMLFDCG